MAEDNAVQVEPFLDKLGAASSAYDVGFGLILRPDIKL